MYRLRDMTVDDKVCEQVSMSLLQEVYPQEIVERCVQQSEPWNSKVRRVRLSTGVALVLFVLAMARREPTQSAPGVGQPGGEAQRPPSGATRQCHE